jgi:hypothetical protein
MMKWLSFSHWGQFEVPAATEYRMSYGYPHVTYGFDTRVVHEWAARSECLPFRPRGKR